MRVLCILLGTGSAVGWVSSPRQSPSQPWWYHRLSHYSTPNDSNDDEGPVEYNDFDDFVLGDSFDSSSSSSASDDVFSPAVKKESVVPILDAPSTPKNALSSTEDVVLPLPQLVPDRSACRTRRFSLGSEVILDRYLGTLGFQEVTDWQYYMTDQDEDGQVVGDRRERVSPNPFDPNQPRRTRQSSGSVLRLFRAEFVGALGGLLRSQGLENRVLIKEFSGELGLALADRETRALAQFQSQLVDGQNDDEDWRTDAMNRFNKPRSDNMHVQKMVQQSAQCPFTIIFGEVDLAEVEEEGWDANEFYRAMKVQPPKPGAVWLVYEYTGVGASATRLTQGSPLMRWDRLPKAKGFFGNPIDPPPLPSWSDRARFLLKGIIGPALEAVACTHEQGIVHRSLGVSSLLVLPKKQTDKAAALSPMWTNVGDTVVKFSDWGFAQVTDPDLLLKDQEFVGRARTFDISLTAKSSPSLLAVNFALAEDMYALGVAIVQLLLSTLAEPLTAQDLLPPIASNEDSFQRLWTDIYDQDMMAFRDYLVNEDKIYQSLVSFLDEREGWKFLEALLNARERVAKNQDAESIVSVKKLLESPLLV